MTSILTLLILLGVWFFIIAPFIRLIRISRQWKDAFSGGGQRQRSRQPEPQPRPKKKIDPTVGEYVEFTETESTHTSTDTSGRQTTTHTSESQIVDVTWEDL